MYTIKSKCEAGELASKINKIVCSNCRVQVDYGEG